MREVSYKVFSARELQRFLRAVDRHLKKPESVVLIGGSAAALAYRVSMGTTDVDTFETDLAPLQSALEQARAETGLNVPVSDTPIADAPYNYQDRLVRVLKSLPRLTVHALERHDLALSKAVRCEENDLAALQELHEKYPLDEALLIERYRDEMTQAIGPRERLDGRFLILVLRLFGEMARDRARSRLAEKRPRRSR